MEKIANILAALVLTFSLQLNIAIGLAAMFSFQGCAVQKLETVNQVGYGEATNWDITTARDMALTRAQGELSKKIRSSVRTATTDYRTEMGSEYESIIETISQNVLIGVKYSGDDTYIRTLRGYKFKVKAHVGVTVGEEVNRYLDSNGYREKMFGD